MEYAIIINYSDGSSTGKYADNDTEAKDIIKAALGEGASPQNIGLYELGLSVRWHVSEIEIVD